VYRLSKVYIITEYKKYLKSKSVICKEKTMEAQAQNISDVLLGYYKRNKKKLIKEAIKNDNVQLSNKLIELYKSLGENLDDIFSDTEVVEEITKKVTTKEEPNLSEIFARKLR